MTSDDADPKAKKKAPRVQKKAVKKVVAKRAATTKTPTKKAPAKKAPVKKVAATKVAATKVAAKKVAAKKAKKSASSRQRTIDDLGPSVGRNVRAERERQGIPVRELARRLGVSASFLSQFELGQSRAAVNTLFAIAAELNLSLDELLGNSAPRGTRRTTASRSRRGAKPSFEEYLSFQSGVRWRRLAGMPDDHRVQFLLTEYDPGSDSAPGDSPQRHAGDDYGYVLDGTLTVDIDGKRQLLHAGEAVHMRGDTPHRLRNETDQIVRAIWFVTT